MGTRERREHLVAPGAQVTCATDGAKRIRRVSPNGSIDTLVGTGVACGSPYSCGDGTSAQAAPVMSPTAVAVAGSGGVFFADDSPTGTRIRKVDAAGQVSTVVTVGSFTHSLALEGRLHRMSCCCRTSARDSSCAFGSDTKRRTTLESGDPAEGSGGHEHGPSEAAGDCF